LAERITREQAIAEGWFTPNDSGLCQCGCGQTTNIPKWTAKRFGHVGGEHVRYVSGHGTKGERNYRWRERPSYNAVHLWARRSFAKLGRCQDCEKEVPTEWANISGVYRRERDDFIELCRPCHRSFDRWRESLLI